MLEIFVKASMISMIEFFLIIATVLSIAGAIVSVYYSYNKIKKNKKLSDNNINRAMIALSDYKENITDNNGYDDIEKLGNILRAERQETLFRFISINDSIPSSIANAAVKEICAFSKDNSPDYIMGVNRGGTMVAAIASLQQGLSSAHFLRCYVDEKEVFFPTTKIKGTILVIDDISRTGSTLVRIKNYILQHFTDVNIITATLFMYFKNGVPVFREVGYYSYRINSQSAKLPWNNVESSKEQQFQSIQNSTISELASDLELQIETQELAIEKVA